MLKGACLGLWRSWFRWGVVSQWVLKGPHRVQRPLESLVCLLDLLSLVH